MSTTSSATSASAWAILGGAGTRGISFLVFLLIARALKPSDMGVMAIALSMGMFADAISELGLGDQIVRYQRADSKSFIDTVFWLQLGVALIAALILILLSPWLAEWYKEDDLHMAVTGVALACVANGASWVPLSLLNKRMEFKAIALRNAMATVLGGLLGLVLTYMGWGVKALIAMHVANAVTGVTVAFYSSRWRPAFSWDFALLKPVQHVAMQAMGTRFVETITSRADQLLIGSFFGASSLGLYALAVRFFDVIFQTICGPVGVVIFSYLAQVQHDLPALRSRYLVALRNLSLLTPGVFLISAMLLPDLLQLFFGAKWVGVTPYLRLILGAGSILAVTFSHTPVFSVIGQPKVNLFVSTASSFFWFASLLLFAKLGALFAAVLWVLRAVLCIPLQLYFLKSLVKLKMVDYGKAIAPASVSALVMVMIYFIFSPDVNDAMPLRIFRLVLIGMGCVASVAYFAYKYSPDVRQNLSTIFGNRRLS